MKKKRGKRYLTGLILLLICSFIVTSCKAQGVTSSSEKSSEISSEVNLPGKTITYYEISFEGGSGKAYIESPVEVTEDANGITARFVWSSKNYDYMIVDGVRYDNENPGGVSTFTVTVPNLDEPLTVIGDTTAMSTPHEIEYVITWLGKTEVSDGDASGNGEKKESGNGKEQGINEGSFDEISIGNLAAESELELTYATGFRVLKYKDFQLIQIKNSGNFLLLEEGGKAPENLPANVTILQKPLDKTYLVSTSVMDDIRELGCMDSIRLSGTKAEDWYIKEAAEAMKNGRILYAGKYRAPDYERILSEGCNLAIENTMIYHNPEVKEKLEELGIPVLVETSSYESHPLGRLEWIKLYGVLYDKEAEAESYYKRQLNAVEPIMEHEKTNVTVAFFYVTSSGMINVRVAGDYITEMIELSGGNYVYPAGKGEDGDPAGDGLMSTMNVQPEDFYLAVKDADVIIYNSTIGGEIHSVDELVKKNELFQNFKAVKNGDVYCTEQNFFQETTGMPEFMKDLNAVFTGEKREYTYIKKLK